MVKRSLTPQEGETLEMIEGNARLQGVLVSREPHCVVVNGPLQMDEQSLCGDCQRVTSEGNCYGYSLCNCGSFRRPIG